MVWHRLFTNVDNRRYFAHPAEDSCTVRVGDHHEDVPNIAAARKCQY